MALMSAGSFFKRICHMGKTVIPVIIKLWLGSCDRKSGWQVDDMMGTRSG